VRKDPQQLHFDVALLGTADQLVSGTIATPVVRWRKLVRLFDPPPGSRCSRKSFQAVAAALADYADRNGSSCWPAVQRLVEDTGYSRRQVQYALAALEERRLVVRDTRGGRGRSSRYELVCRRPVDNPGEPVENPVDNAVDRERLELERVRETTPKGRDTSHPRSAIEVRHHHARVAVGA
jgi:hypothetical protein